MGQSAATPGQFTVVKPEGDSLRGLLAEEVSKALKLGQRPYVQFFADWCGPCRALRASLTDPLMQDAFAGTYIVQLSADRWAKLAPASGFSFSSVPIFFELAPSGSPTGRCIDGNAWGANTPANMAAPLKKFFAHGREKQLDSAAAIGNAKAKSAVAKSLSSNPLDSPVRDKGTEESIKVQCPCGNQWEVAASLRGKRILCAACHQRVPVPGGGPPPTKVTGFEQFGTYGIESASADDAPDDESAASAGMWEVPGYQSLPLKVLLELERARACARAGQWQQAIDLLDDHRESWGKRAARAPAYLVHRPLALCLHASALAKLARCAEQVNEASPQITRLLRRAELPAQLSKEERHLLSNTEARDWMGLPRSGSPEFIDRLNRLTANEAGIVCVLCGTWVMSGWREFTFRYRSCMVCSACKDGLRVERHTRERILDKRIPKIREVLQRAQDLDPELRRVRQAFAQVDALLERERAYRV